MKLTMQSYRFEIWSSPILADVVIKHTVHTLIGLGVNVKDITPYSAMGNIQRIVYDVDSTNYRTINSIIKKLDKDIYIKDYTYEII